MEGEWIKSSFSTAAGNNCVEVMKCCGGAHIYVRDSKHPAADYLLFNPAEWDAFLAGVRAGEFDIEKLPRTR